MKNFLSVCWTFGMGLIAGCVAAGIAHADTNPSFKPALIDQKPANIYAPQGFDDNDNSQLVVYGFLPSTCHKTGPVKYHVDEASKTIFIRSYSYFYSGCFCAQVEVPYTQLVNLGVLDRGRYTVVAEAGDGSRLKMAELPVAVATVAAPDDFFYAPVDHMHFTPARPGEGPTVTLGGTLDASCISPSDVKVTYRANQVIEIQPVADVNSTGCVGDMRPFSLNVKLRGDLHGRALIHVRSLNGQSLNQVIDL